MRNFVLTISILFSLLPGFSQEPRTFYRVSLKDKVGTLFSVNHPEEFLSPQTLTRRTKFNIFIDETDLPVSQAYIDSLTDAGFQIIHQSKWNNTVTVASSNGNALNGLLSFSFVLDAKVTKPLLLTKSASNKFENIIPSKNINNTYENYYGKGWEQIHQLRGELLHERGYKGEGIRIAVLDAGFAMVDTLSAFKTLHEQGRLLGTRDFVNPGGNVFEEHSHGTFVLGTMATELPGQMVGTAPKASYWLLRTEDDASEYPIEEDNWIAGLEFADSVGADIASSSLGYYIFDDSLMDHPFSDLDGQNTRITRAANMAVQKGMIVVNSAGNEGNNTWKKIILPADGDNVLTVGAVNNLGERASFSSLGPNASGLIKPNVMARGIATWSTFEDGTLAQSNGTSFSTPIIAGVVACLHQAFPLKTPLEIKEMIEQSGHLHSTPDTLMGYGIPNIESILSTQKRDVKENQVSVSPNPFQNIINIRSLNPVIEISLYDLNGFMLINKKGANYISTLAGLENLQAGIYILEVSTKDHAYRQKLLKN